jgi:hypothetical protein
MPFFKPRPNVNLVGLLDYSDADLILIGDRLWNVDLLNDLFYLVSIQNILQIHLPRISTEDKWSWIPSLSGIFSVKSAREVSITLSTRFHPFTPIVWQALWGLKLQARLKHLLWKIGCDILASRANIGRFIILEDANAWVCPFCNGPLETLSHIFLDCALAKVLWRFALWPLKISHFSSRPIYEWILAIIYPLNRLDIPTADYCKFQLFAALVMDLIWQSRNKLIHDGILPNLALAIQQLKVTLQSHYLA